MSDKEETTEKPFYVDRAKTGRAGCKKCKQKIGQGELRFAKLGHNPFGSGTMKLWHHIPCMFEVFKKQRVTTKKIESPDDIGGWYDLQEEDREEIAKYFSPELLEIFVNHKKSQETEKIVDTINVGHAGNENQVEKRHKDHSFRAFRKLCADISAAASYNTKTKIVKEFFIHGSDGFSFKGDIQLWCKLLLPGAVKRVYNVQSKQLIKIFSRILGTNHEEMLEDLEKGDVAETISSFFDKSDLHSPTGKSTLTLQDVDSFLETLSTLTKEEEQTNHFRKIIKRCTLNDIKMIIRLIKHDLRINAGPKHILEGIHPDAYKAFQTSRDLKAVVKNALKAEAGTVSENKSSKTVKRMSIDLKIMTPVLPMLAQACKSTAMAMKKCPNGMYSEIKYDGERIQLHKEGNNFRYFSRSLKPMLAHKVQHFKEYIPQAFHHGKDLILDGEILMVDNSGKPLPFGTLGIHKKNEFKDANVCLFVFDCIYFNGESLIGRSIRERKEILQKNMTEIKNRIMFSEMQEIHKAEDLEDMMTKVFKLGLEGLILKDLKSKYEPGKRHWLKVKKDYLFGGAMADSADLVVLGAWFGTGHKGGIMSVFLMGCHDEQTKKWLTVTKVHGGHDDSTLERLQTELEMVKISRDASKVPKWLKCSKSMVPDFVARDVLKMPVWEITGAEFTRNQVHTAEGISIRFPRVTRIRDDKDWSTATTLAELRKLYEASKNTASFSLADGKNSAKARDADEDDDSGEDTEDYFSSPQKRKSDCGSGNTPSPKKSKLAPVDDSDDTDTDQDIKSDNCSVFNRDDIENPLPDIFQYCVIQMPQNYEENDFLRRYLIAYGAVLFDANKKTGLENAENKVTHVVHLKRKSAVVKEDFWADHVRHVHINWVWDSIKLLERQNEKNYAITCV